MTTPGLAARRLRCSAPLCRPLPARLPLPPPPPSALGPSLCVAHTSTCPLVAPTPCIATILGVSLTPTQVLNPAVVERLGQVHRVVTDTVGTLTEHRATVGKCLIGTPTRPRLCPPPDPDPDHAIPALTVPPPPHTHPTSHIPTFLSGPVLCAVPPTARQVASRTEIPWWRSGRTSGA